MTTLTIAIGRRHGKTPREDRLDCGCLLHTERSFVSFKFCNMHKAAEPTLKALDLLVAAPTDRVARHAAYDAIDLAQGTTPQR